MMDESQDPAKASVFERAVELNWLKRVFAQRRQQRQKDIMQLQSSSNEQQHDAKKHDAEEQSSVVVPPPLFPSESTLNISALFDDPEEKEASSEDLSNSDITTWDQAEPTTQEANEYRAYCDKILFGL